MCMYFKYVSREYELYLLTVRQELFEEQALIAYPALTGLQWCKPSQCVWRGPSFLTRKRILSDIYLAQQDAERLFITFLNISDATHNDVLDDLALRATQSNPSNRSVRQMLEVYKTLAAMAKTDIAATDIR